jgi:hypothetical protein
LKYLLFGYGLHLVHIARNVAFPGKLPSDKLPKLGVKNNVGNMVIKFDENWKKEPRKNPNIWRAL